MEKYFRNHNIIDGTLDNHQIMMHLEKGKYFGLNPIGKRIWELLEQPKTLEELVSVLLSEYEVSEEQCRQEVFDFLQKAFIQNVIIKHDLD
jgi:hypothetical protein